MDSTAFVFSLANSKFIFLTFFYLFSSHSLPLCLPHHPHSSVASSICVPPLSICIHLRRRSLLSPLSITYFAFFFLLLFFYCVSPACLSPSIPPPTLLSPSFCISLPPPHLLLLVPHSPSGLSAGGTHTVND